MADIKITDLTALTADLADTDVFPVVDVSADTTKKITVANLRTLALDGAVSTIAGDDLTASRALASNSSGKVAVSAVTSTELGYLSGVSSAVQTQINLVNDSPVNNRLANGNFDIWTRGTSTVSPADDSYVLPHWNFLQSGGNTYTVSQQAASSTNHNGSRYYCRVAATAGEAGAWVGIVNFIEAADAIPLRGKTVSLYYRAMSPSAAIGTLYNGVAAWDGTADSITSDIVSSWSATPTLVANWTFESSGSQSLTGAFLPYALEGISLDTSSLKNIAVFFWWQTDVSATAAVDIAQVQLSIGSTVVAFVPRLVSQEQQLCDRRYLRLTGDASGNGPAVSAYASAGSQVLKTWTTFSTPMRTTPNGTVGGTWALSNCTGPTLTNVSSQGFALAVTSSAAGLCTAASDGTDDTLSFDAEL